MTDVLLITPPYKDYEKERNNIFDVTSLGTCFPPLGLSYIASYCQEAGYKVELIDMELECMKLSKLIKEISKLKPKVIGISCPSVLFPIVLKICKRIKDNYSIPIVVGGPHTFINPTELVKEESIDFVVRKEGEQGFVGLLKYLINNEGSLSKVKNLSYKVNGKIIRNEEAEALDLDELPFPARDILKLTKYYHLMSKSHKTTFLITARGCPFNCIFCNPLYKKLRKRSVKDVIKEIKLIIDKYNIRDIEFFDETFNVIPSWVIEFCNELLKQNIKIKWRARCRPDSVNEEMIQLMKKAGCYSISLGVESANDRILKFLRKGYTFKQTEEAIRIMEKYGIKVHGYIIIGSPIETKEEILNTINFAAKSKLDFASFFILMPYAGTDLFDLAQKNDWLLKDYNRAEFFSEQLGERKSMLKNQYLSKKEIESLLNRANIKFYLNYRRIFNISRMILLNPIIYSILFYRYIKRAI